MAYRKVTVEAVVMVDYSPDEDDPYPHGQAYGEVALVLAHLALLRRTGNSSELTAVAWPVVSFEADSAVYELPPRVVDVPTGDLL